MEEEYNWNLIIKTALPISAVEAYLFYISIGDIWKWLSLFIGILLAGTIIYMNGRKKGDTFTAIGIVFLAVLIARFLKGFGLI